MAAPAYFCRSALLSGEAGVRRGYKRCCGLALSAEGLGDVGAWRLARPTNKDSGGTLQLGKRAIAEPSGRAPSWGS